SAARFELRQASGGNTVVYSLPAFNDLASLATKSMGGVPMRNFLLTTCFGAVAALAAGTAHANDELIKMSQNPKDWVMPTGNYANQRYSALTQITADNT